MKNIEKIIFALFLILLIGLIAVSRAGLLTKIEVSKLPKAPEEFKIPEKDRIQFEKYDSLLKERKDVKNLSYYAALAGQNLFFKYEEPKPVIKPFVVKDIQAVPLDIVYQGVIELGKGVLIAQINLEGKTYFLKSGDIFSGYTVKKISKDFCLIVDVQGKEMELPYQGRVFSEEYEAVLYDRDAKKMLKVKKDFKISGYQVLDIKANYVILLDENGNKITLLKGEK